MIQSRDNLFSGINPHLMSFLQTPGSGATTSTFPSFHKDHITHIKDFLNDVLPPHYIALSEPSLQKRARIERNRRWTSVAVYDAQDAEHGVHGQPVVRIEVLSPANMPGGSYAGAYQQNRARAILGGTALVEVDYLHEYRSPVAGVPVYPDEDGSQPYTITVTRPTQQQVDVYLFGIQMPIPTVTIPLAGEESVAFDFGQPYGYTWRKSRFWFYVDYTQAPARFTTYSAADRTTIRARMGELAKEHSNQL
jgi:hypothetical protein